MWVRQWSGFTFSHLYALLFIFIIFYIKISIFLGKYSKQLRQIKYLSANKTNGKNILFFIIISV